MSKMGQAVQRSQEGEIESFEPDPLYDDWQEQQKADPASEEFLDKLDNSPF